MTARRVPIRYAVGIESRDWYRKESRKPKRQGMSRGGIAVLGLIVVSLLLVASPTVRHRLGFNLPFGLEKALDGKTGAVRVQVLPGTPGVTLSEQPLYEDADPWKAWLADETTCPRGEDRSAPQRVQVQVLLCLVNYARAREGLSQLTISPLLTASSNAKAAEIVQCSHYAHEPCGLQADHDLVRADSTGGSARTSISRRVAWSHRGSRLING